MLPSMAGNWVYIQKKSTSHDHKDLSSNHTMPKPRRLELLVLRNYSDLRGEKAITTWEIYCRADIVAYLCFTKGINLFKL